MMDLESYKYRLGAWDALAGQDSAVHRIDPCAKIITVLAFILAVVSFDRYAFSSLVPFVFFPLILAAAGGVPLGSLGRKIALVAPFALMLGLFNPLLDRHPVVLAGSVTIAGGWVSFASIFLRFVLTVAAALVLVAVTGIHAVASGLERLGVPRVFAVQILFLHRYLFVLSEEAARMARARACRSLGKQGSGLGSYGPMVGHLLLRTVDRAQRIHVAMTSRGFDGEVRLLRSLRFRGRDLGFVLGWSAFFVTLRIWNVPRILGDLISGVGP